MSKKKSVFYRSYHCVKVAGCGVRLKDRDLVLRVFSGTGRSSISAWNPGYLDQPVFTFQLPIRQLRDKTVSLESLSHCLRFQPLGGADDFKSLFPLSLLPSPLALFPISVFFLFVFFLVFFCPDQKNCRQVLLLCFLQLIKQVLWGCF